VSVYTRWSNRFSTDSGSHNGIGAKPFEQAPTASTELLGRCFVCQELLMTAPLCVAVAGRVFPRGAPFAAVLFDASEMFVVRDLAYYGLLKK